MEFKHIKTAVQKQFNEIKDLPLFRVQLDKDKLWETYLKSFPEGTNPKFRERTEHDCSCCRSFIKNIGDLVAIKDGQLVSIFDGPSGDYQVIADALSAFVKSHPIDNVFAHPEAKVGVDKNFAQKLGEEVATYEHFFIQLPVGLYMKGDQIGPLTSEMRASHDVLLRSLQEITVDSIETVQDLIAQNGLYRGAEKKGIVDAFAKLKLQFNELTTDTQRELFVWSKIRGQTAFVNKIRNDVIGTLLIDLSEGKELDVAVASFENKVSGTNYKRPTALITPKMRDQAKAKLEELGLVPALERRYAVLDDIKIGNVLFANRNTKKKIAKDVFDTIDTKTSAKTLDKVEEITITDFVNNVLPKAKSLEVMVENRHQSNLVSLTAPADASAPTLFKWDNPFAWSYNGDVADSIKERVKKAGGAVEGDVCCRLAWNNDDDLDFYMSEPGGHTIFFRNRGRQSPNGGILDVDANGIDGKRPDPCENIVYGDAKKMKNGTYKLHVNQYSQCEKKNIGFDVEIDVNGTVHRFAYPNEMRSGAIVQVAELHVSAEGVKVVPKLSATTSTPTKEVWGIKTQTFQPVAALMLSPNYWDGKDVGNKHFFFMLDGCKNDGQARGFYNEFLKNDLEAHRKTMEIVGSKMKTEQSENQLSGVGFSSTQRNSVLCKVEGSFTRILKVVF